MKVLFAASRHVVAKLSALAPVLLLVFMAPSAQAQMVGTIGVGDLKYAGDEQSLMPIENIVSELNSDLNKSLLETRKFTVLDYAQLQGRFENQNLELQGFYDKSYTSTELQQAGLDYILTADVIEFGAFKQERGNSNNVIGLVEIEFKLLGVADATDDFSSSVSAQTRMRMPSEGSVDKADVMSQALQQAVDQLVDQVISILHPIRVMKISDDSVITLNYGDGILEAGDTILVYPKGQDIELDASGEAVGESIATLQVISTEKKFANAQALNGFDALEKGQKGRLLLTGG